MSNDAVVDAVTTGYRLPRPPLCPTEIYALMRSCWEDVPERPSFADLEQSLGMLLAMQKQRETLQGLTLITTAMNSSQHQQAMQVEVERRHLAEWRES